MEAYSGGEITFGHRALPERGMGRHAGQDRRGTGVPARSGTPVPAERSLFRWERNAFRWERSGVPARGNSGPVSGGGVVKVTASLAFHTVGAYCIGVLCVRVIDTIEFFMTNAEKTTSL